MLKPIGNKAIFLSNLRSSGFNIPLFLSFDSETSFDHVKVAVLEKFKANTILAVRSSSILEDGKEQSFAGAFRTDLGIGISELEQAWGNVKRSLPLKNQDGIIIQEFIPGEYSGVTFIDNNIEKASINALPGICKPVTDGWDCEQYDYHKGLLVNKRVNKIYNCIQFSDGKLTKNKLPASNQEVLLMKVIEISKRIADYFGTPQDIEWTSYKQEIFILQSRPISKSIWGKNQNNMLFDSANIGESYSGIVSPLTSSFAKSIYKFVYTDLLVHSGVPIRKMNQNSEIFSEMVDNVYGRLYYRMDNWYRMMAMLPGFNRNSKNLRKMLSLNFEEHQQLDKFKPNVFLTLTYFPRILLKFLFFNKKIKKFRNEIESIIRNSQKWNFEEINLEQAQEKIRSLMNGILRKWYLTVENDTIMMTAYGKLTKSITSDELSKLLDFPSETTRQINSLCNLSKILCESEVIKQSLKKKNKQSFIAALNSYPEKKEHYEKYLMKFGGRFANELKLETKNITEDFNAFSTMILSYSNRKYEPENQSSTNGKFLEKLFKKTASRREDFRLLRANMFAIIRKLCLHIGNCFVEKGLIKNKNDIFFLDIDSVNGIIPEREIDFLKIKKKKREYDFFKTFHPPSHFKVRNGKWSVLENGKNNSGNNGTGVSPGKIIGKAIVLKKFEIPKKDSFDIIVTRRTDPGWTALMGLSKGIIVEHGGILSHASIVARELGIPAVIGINGACEKFNTGDILFIDGEKGFVKRVENDTQSP